MWSVNEITEIILNSYKDFGWQYQYAVRGIVDGSLEGNECGFWANVLSIKILILSDVDTITLVASFSTSAGVPIHVYQPGFVETERHCFENGPETDREVFLWLNHIAALVTDPVRNQLQ